MANNKNTERENVTGLELADDRKEAEYDLVTALLEAASFKTASDSVTEIEIRRGGKFLFTVHIHPISDADVKQARKYAGIYKDNPTNKKLGKVRVDTDDAKFGSWLIYLATTEADQEKIWGNSEIKKKFNLMQPWESVDILLKGGEKSRLIDEVLKISDLTDDENDETMDEETFQS